MDGLFASNADYSCYLSQMIHISPINWNFYRYFGKFSRFRPFTDDLAGVSTVISFPATKQRRITVVFPYNQLEKPKDHPLGAGIPR